MAMNDVYFMFYFNMQLKKYVILLSQREGVGSLLRLITEGGMPKNNYVICERPQSIFTLKGLFNTSALISTV